jgi:hypothetical protein
VASSAVGKLPSAVPSVWSRAGWTGRAAAGFSGSNSALALLLRLEPRTEKCTNLVSSHILLESNFIKFGAIIWNAVS